MTLLAGLVVIVLAVAILWWALSTVPLPGPFRWIINVVFALIALWVLFKYVAPALGVRV